MLATQFVVFQSLGSIAATVHLDIATRATETSIVNSSQNDSNNRKGIWGRRKIQAEQARKIRKQERRECFVERGHGLENEPKGGRVLHDSGRKLEWNTDNGQ